MEEVSTQKNVPQKTLLALFLFMIALSIYSETESQWFNSFVSEISGKGSLYVGYMVSASGIVGAVAFIAWGAYSDNSDSIHGRRKPILVIGSILTGIFVILFGISSNYWWLFVCDGIIIAITSNMFHVSNRALVPDIWPVEERGKTNTYLFVGSSVGSAFLWILSLLILPGNAESYSRETHQMIFNISGILLVVIGIILWFWIKEPIVKVERKGYTESIMELFDFREMRKHSSFFKLFIASLFTIMAMNAFKPFILIMLQDLSLTTGNIILAGVLLITSVVGVVFGMLRSLDRVGRKRATLIGSIIAPIGCLILAFSNWAFLPMIIGLIIILPFMTGLQIAVDTWTQDLLPENKRGRFLGIINITKAAGQAPAVLLSGWVADITGSVLNVFIIAGLFLLIGIPLYLRVPETLKKKESNPELGEKLNENSN